MSKFLKLVGIFAFAITCSESQATLVNNFSVTFAELSNPFTVTCITSGSCITNSPTSTETLTATAVGSFGLTPSSTIPFTTTLIPSYVIMTEHPGAVSLTNLISDVISLTITGTGTQTATVKMFSDTVSVDFGVQSAAALALHAPTVFEDGTSQDLTSFFDGALNNSASLWAEGNHIFASSDVAAIPEPEIYLMMGIGLALMGFVARRRQGQAAAA